MKFKTYTLNIERLAKMLRKHGAISNKLKGMQAMREAIFQVYMHEPKTIYTMDFVIQTEEYYWLSHGRRMYYVPDIALADSMLRASSKVLYAHAFYDGPESFILNFPSDVKFDGRPAQAVLVTLSAPPIRATEFVYPYLQWMGAKGRPTVETFKADFSINLAYQESGGHEFEYFRCCIGSDMIPKYLETKTGEEWDTLMREYNQFHYLQGATLDSANEHYQYELVRFVLNFLLYKKALPERIREGLPGINRREVETPFITNRDHFVIQPPGQTRESPTSHYRSWHFRQLLHSRFYRGEYEHMVPGSRVVFVSDSFVGLNADHNTIEENDNGR